MATPVTLPALGESVTEGTVTRWLKQVGDTIAVDEPLLEVSTDKVDTEIPSPVAGTLLEIKADEDETVEVGAELAVVGESGESGGTPAEPAAEEQAEQQAEPEPAAQEQAAPASEPEPAPEPAPAAQAPASGGSANGTPVTLPELGESVTEGTVTRWLKQVGDTIAVDEPLLEISTDKVDTEIPSPVAGTLLEIKADEDETIEVGAELAIVGGDGAAAAPAAEPTPEPEGKSEPEPAPTPQPAQPAPTPPQAPAAQAAPQQSSAPAPSAPAASTAGNGSGSQAYVTPIVRKLANQHGVDLDSIAGSGVGGRIRKQDVLDAAKKPEPVATPAPAPAPAAQSAAPSPDLSGLRGTVQKASRIRQITATKTKESLQGSAQLTQVHEVDVTKIARLRERSKASFQQREGVKLTFLPFFAKATVEALKQHPNVNASYDEDAKEITYHGAINLGIAVDTEQGLLSVVIHDAGDLSLSGLAQRIADLAARARSNKLKPDELSGGTFTVTNLGSNGALFDTPILVQPQSAMLGTGAVVKRPVVIADADGSDTIAIRSMVYLPLTYDHRLIDGADAGRFLTTIKRRLEEGGFEPDLGL
ncbi:2-oxoglutarate dehydrogenase, E2 component, dihydrolipoamide succinyltransferase [Solicola gregarius]|uniref:Dihydrolipoamide acetyltransferase component of pyruvate dehydrogenase complex n=1 Tax=Solicola gregarius TaxID=2908642 RepID=A0AA46YLE9_9ACTN|nr:2-oxoglutarate dehydrogenase, E2 component, dihydrolipoamide succinyltransferase [Solicola gregarius]UYM05441.1 2-oxoglutarate dehydrogenase, E2 component, dihydrolipoamide succinyltransferase [Solicola gregarius]